MSTNGTNEAPNRIALVTGANRGLGFATARLLGQAGVKVLVGSRDLAAGEVAASRLSEEGIDAEASQIDVTAESSVRRAAAAVADRYSRLDILVNNAGVLPEATATGIGEPLDLRMFRETFETNVFGAASVTEHFLPLLANSTAGRIVNVSSRMGSLADQTDPESPYFEMVVPAYQASKAALNGLTVALSKALADSAITVNSVCPGWVQTDLGGPDNRAAAPTTADDAAATVANMALVSQSPPSGQFVDRAGTIAW